MLKQSFCLFLLTIAFSINVHAKTPNTTQDSVGITKNNGKFYLKYMVSPGETVYRISTKYKTSISDLIDLNPELEFGLKTGQIITIPYSKMVEEEKTQDFELPKTSTVEAVSSPISKNAVNENQIIHEVKPGETFAVLAQKYGTTIEKLLIDNKIEPKPGQKIIINKTLKEEKASLEGKKQDVVKVSESQPIKTESIEIKTEKEPLVAQDYDNAKHTLLVIPFDPYLYFSDADDEISATSKMQRTKVRQAFRRRLNALVEPQGYETIHLLGGNAKDSLTDLNKIYSSVTYSYQSILYDKTTVKTDKKSDKGQLNTKELNKKSEYPQQASETSRASLAKDPQKYFGVKVNNPAFFTYFNNKYKVDFYLFVNQFEVKTNYENCIDRATMNYERGFTTHYSIFDKSGKQIAGNRIYTPYNSNTNQINKILSDNMQKVADRIMADLPPAK
jgi:LysM repeat protein